MTFYSNGVTTTTRPLGFCVVEATPPQCTKDLDANSHLHVPPGKALQISVPSQIGDAPWGVAFSYRNAKGETVDRSSEVFAPESSLSYTLTLPDPADQLLQVSVQVLGAVRQDETGNIVPVQTGYWLLVVDPAA